MSLRFGLLLRTPPPSTPPAVPQQIIPERAEASAAAAAFPFSVGVLGQTGQQNRSLTKMELSDIAQDKPALIVSVFLSWSGIHFLYFLLNSFLRLMSM